MSESPLRRGPGRPRVAPGPVGTESTPEQRGYHSIRLRADALAKLDSYVVEHAHKGRSAAVLELVERAASPGPWQRIKEELLTEFGYVARKQIDAALMRAGWAGE